MSDFVRYIVKCVQSHRDGMTDPSEVRIGEIIDITERQWLRLKQSAPFSFELIERRVPRPGPEEELFDPAVPIPEPLDITEAVKKQMPKKKRAPKKAAAQDAKS